MVVSKDVILARYLPWHSNIVIQMLLQTTLKFTKYFSNTGACGVMERLRPGLEPQLSHLLLITHSS